MPIKITLDFCTLEFIDKIAIAVINEGVHVDYEISKAIAQACTNYFKQAPFVYLSLRTNSYSVDVTKYSTLVNQMENLKGFGVISTSLSARNAEIESLFLDLPFAIFDDLDEGLKWAKNILDKNPKRIN